MAEYVPPPTELLQLITDDRVATLLSNIPFMAQILPYAGSVLAVIRTFRPVETYEAAVIQWFRQLSEQLERNDRNLENIIRIEALNLRYGEHIVSIKTAINSSANIARARDDAERQRYVEILKDVCSGQRHTLAMNDLIEGLRGTGTLQTNIMDHYYEYTGGDPSRVRSFTKELLQLVYAGFTVMCTYETLMHDQRFAEDVLNEYTDRMKEVQENIQVVFDRMM